MCRQETLKDLLDDYKYFAGLLTHWVLMGPSGRETRPEAGGVLRDYTLCGQRAEGIGKTIANTHFLRRVDLHPHNFVFWCALSLKRCIFSRRRGPGGWHASACRRT